MGGQCSTHAWHCMNLFSLEAETEDDFEAGLENDFAESSVHVERLRQSQARPLSDAEKHAFSKIFDGIDKHYSPGAPGRIHRRDIAAYFNAHYNPLTPRELEELMDVADTNRSGDLDKDEFLVVAKKIHDTAY